MAFSVLAFLGHQKGHRQKTHAQTTLEATSRALHAIQPCSAKNRTLSTAKAAWKPENSPGSGEQETVFPCPFSSNPLQSKFMLWKLPQVPAPQQHKILVALVFANRPRPPHLNAQQKTNPPPPPEKKKTHTRTQNGPSPPPPQAGKIAPNESRPPISCYEAFQIRIRKNVQKKTRLF